MLLFFTLILFAVGIAAIALRGHLKKHPFHWQTLTAYFLPKVWITFFLGLIYFFLIGGSFLLIRQWLQNHHSLAGHLLTYGKENPLSFLYLALSIAIFNALLAYILQTALKLTYLRRQERRWQK